MKKGLKLGAALLSGLMVFGAAGCGKDGVSDAEGKKWAEKNGYVKVSAPELPAPVDDTNADCDTGNIVDSFNPTCSTINKSNLHQYMGLEGVEYIDIRDAVKVGNNDDFVTGTYSGQHLLGFRNVGYNEYITGNGNQLFYKLADGTFAPRYTNSVDILKDLFPQDKTLFIMCQSGTRVGYMMTLLNQYGWDMSKIYNVGGMGQYTTAEFDPYKVTNTAANEYDVYDKSYTGSVGGGNVTVDVKVLLTKTTKEIGAVYITGGTYYSSDSYKTKVDAELVDLLNSFVGLDVDELRETATASKYGKDGADVVAGATDSTKLIYNAVVAAVDGVEIE